MTDYLLIGLLVLFPLEIFFLIILWASQSKESVKPSLDVPAKKVPVRYGWEDYLKLPTQSMDTRASQKTKSSKVILFLFALVVFSLLIYSTSTDLFPSSNKSLTPTFNESNTTSTAEYSFEFPYISPIYWILPFIVFLITAGAVYLIKQRSSVFRKANVAADKVSNDPKSSGKWQGIIARVAKFLAPFMLVFLLLGLIYAIKSNISSSPAASLAMDFGSKYIYFIVAGIAMLAGTLVFVFRFFK